MVSLGSVSCKNTNNNIRNITVESGCLLAELINKDMSCTRTTSTMTMSDAHS